MKRITIDRIPSEFKRTINAMMTEGGVLQYSKGKINFHPMGNDRVEVSVISRRKGVKFELQFYAGGAFSYTEKRKQLPASFLDWGWEKESDDILVYEEPTLLMAFWEMIETIK